MCGMPRRNPFPTAERRRRARANGGTALLPAFFIAVLAMVAAVVAMAKIDRGWADLAAVAFLVVVAVLLLLAIGRLIGNDEEDQP
jgi:membrane protein YdbS with pleckstrin-like domain